VRGLVRDTNISAYRCSDCGWLRREGRHLSGHEKKEDLKAAFHLHRCDEHHGGLSNSRKPMLKAS
jgi:hypothetical protein